jgi:hypothetical protein
VIKLDGYKDPLDLHRADPEGFVEAFEAAMAAAVPLTDLDPPPTASPSAIQQLFDEVSSSLPPVRVLKSPSSCSRTR